jgi:uncharacterized membrane protein
MSKGNRPLIPQTKNAAAPNQPVTPQNPALPNVHVQQEVFQGPIPHYTDLGGYGSIDPSFPDRIVKMAESHVAADVKTKNRKSWAEMYIPLIAQILTFYLAYPV